MMRFATAVTLTLVMLLAPGCVSLDAHTPAPGSTGARIYDGFGDYSRPVSTDSAAAQAWFDQGMQLLYGFNHDEAVRSFLEAAARDPELAMAWWGIAYAHGININDPEMTRERSLEARRAARQAMRLIDNASPAEAALIRAVDQRYAWPPPAGRRPLDEAYADAMAQAWNEHPDDPDIGALYSEALMNLQPWDYWTDAGEPKGRIEEVVRTLETVLAMRPDHPGANHFYIHAVEASTSPERAVAAADRLRTLVPAAGHLVHMPSHIYVRVGRYPDAADANQEAIEADRAYFAAAPEPRFYWLYYAHNIHFLAFASMMEGRSAVAMDAARQLEREMPEEFLREYAHLVEGLMPTTYHVMIRFGMWDEILSEPSPPDFRLLTNAVRHYARGVALSALGRTEEAHVEKELFEEAVSRVPDDWWIFNNRVHQVLPIARAMLEGELLFREGHRSAAFAALRRGIEAEDALIYDEPPGWMLPVRHALGALLMSDQRYGEAEAVYREDLRRHPGNGWALLGLRESLRARGKMTEAKAADSQLALAWPRADVEPTSSCYCEPGATALR